MPRFIPDDILEQIRSRADIVEIVQSYVPTLKRAGGSAWKACCPFHQEKTPSFTVNVDRQTFKCFGCGKGGNVFTFVMEMEKLDFPNAAEFLARKYGVVIPDPEPRQGHGGHPGRGIAFESKENDYDARERLYTLHEKLAEWYARNLAENAVPAVSAYFKTRGIPSDFTRKFMIGASPDSWDAAVNFAHKLGYDDRDLRRSGIVSEKEDQPGHIYDRFRGRLMFPIWNEQGRVVAFSSRSVEKDPKGWKYINSPENPVFKKSRTLYALHFARKPIAEKKYAVLCEGQLDVIAMHRAGCDNAVAAQGTAFGIEHAKILKRYTSEIRLALDSDEAGRKAVLADAAILLPQGFSLRVVSWPGAKDADEVLKGQGEDAVRKAVEEAEDFFDFVFARTAAKYDISGPSGKAQAAGELLEQILLLDSPAARDAYLLWLADKLALSPDSLRSDLERRLAAVRRGEQFRERREAERENRTPAAPLPAPEKKNFSDRSEGLRDAFRQVLLAVLADKTLAEAAAHDIGEGVCDDTPVCRALDLAIEFALNGEWEDAPSRILMELSKTGEDVTQLAGMLTEAEDIPDDEKRRALLAERRNRVYHDCVRLIRMEYCRARMDELKNEAAALADDDPGKLNLMRGIIEWTRRLRDISRTR